MVKWILDSVWLALYWIAWGGPFGYLRLQDQELSSSQLQLLSSLLYWTSHVIWFVSWVSMIILIIRGALTITQERQVVSAGISGQK